VATGSVLWRSRGKLQLTIVIKARLQIRHGEMMQLASKPKLESRDVHHGGDPTRSVCRASDMVPFRPRADVWMTGHAHAPAGRPVRVALVRLGLYQGSVALLDKMVYVQGDLGPEGKAALFERVPLTFERAYGGIGHDLNPVGVGADEREQQPNVIDPVNAENPAAFGPISRYWKARRQHVSTQVRRALDKKLIEIPDDFSWSYFQAAPHDQQVPYLRGDEWLVIDGVHATLLRLQTRLPKIRGVARFIDADGDTEGEEVAMAADMLSVNADEQTCELSWRGIVPVQSEQQLSEMRIGAGVELAGQPIDWSEALQAAEIEEPPPELQSETRLLDQSGVTIITGPPVPAETLDDALSQTRIDPPRPDADKPTSSHARVVQQVDPQLEQTMRSRVARPRYPRSQAVDAEATDTSVQALPFDRFESGDAAIPMAIETEPGHGPISSGELTWSDETGESVGGLLVPQPQDTLDDLDYTTVQGPPTVPDQQHRPPPPPPPPVPPPPPRRKKKAPPRPLIQSLPPPPFDPASHANSLRDAGASDDDIAASLDAADDGDSSS